MQISEIRSERDFEIAVDIISEYVRNAYANAMYLGNYDNRPWDDKRILEIVPDTKPDTIKKTAAHYLECGYLASYDKFYELIQYVVPYAKSDDLDNAIQEILKAEKRVSAQGANLYELYAAYKKNPLMAFESAGNYCYVLFSPTKGEFYIHQASESKQTMPDEYDRKLTAIKANTGAHDVVPLFEGYFYARELGKAFGVSNYSFPDDSQNRAHTYTMHTELQPNVVFSNLIDYVAGSQKVSDVEKHVLENYLIENEATQPLYIFRAGEKIALQSLSKAIVKNVPWKRVLTSLLDENECSGQIDSWANEFIEYAMQNSGGFSKTVPQRLIEQIKNDLGRDFGLELKGEPVIRLVGRFATSTRYTGQSFMDVKGVYSTSYIVDPIDPAFDEVTKKVVAHDLEEAISFVERMLAMVLITGAFPTLWESMGPRGIAWLCDLGKPITYPTSRLTPKTKEVAQGCGFYKTSVSLHHAN